MLLEVCLVVGLDAYDPQDIVQCHEERKHFGANDDRDVQILEEHTKLSEEETLIVEPFEIITDEKLVEKQRNLNKSLITLRILVRLRSSMRVDWEIMLESDSRMRQMTASPASIRLSD